MTWIYVAWSLLPVLLAIRFAFNEGRSRTSSQGFSLRWFWTDPTLSVRNDPTLWAALQHSLVLAGLAMLIATPLGTALAIGLQRWRGRGSGVSNVLMLLPLVTPELVFAVGLFLLFTSAFGFIGLGTTAQVIGHVTFSLSWVVLIVRGRLVMIGRDVEEAAADLGAPQWEVLRRVLLPLLAPAIAAALLSTFALSIDDFVVAQYMASGADTTTVPMRIYATARAAPTPALNALATVMLVFSLLALTLGVAGVQALLARSGDVGEHVRGGSGAMSRGQIDLDQLFKRYGDVVAVDGIDLHMPGGEFFTMLGPSGCGKTSTLRLIAGFEKLDSGAIKLDGVDMAHKPPHKRPVNTVFQSYALFPHMTVAENVAFGLRYQKCGKAETTRRVGEAMEMVQLGALGARRPGQLSGGQQQRVALARAIVLEPPVLLLDEPLGALDARLRVDLQVELKRIQETLGITFVYVTHDQDEALTMSDRVAVMKRRPRRAVRRAARALRGAGDRVRGQLPRRVEPDPGDGLGRRAAGRRVHAARERQRPDRRGAGDDPARARAAGAARRPAARTACRGWSRPSSTWAFTRTCACGWRRGALVRCDVPNDGTPVEHSSGDPVSVHLPADCLRVLEP